MSQEKNKNNLFQKLNVHICLLLVLIAMTGASSNPYQLLSVDRSSSQVDIRRAYRKKALMYHPDKCKEEDCNGMFQAVAEAYETLSDPEKKENYDKYGDKGGGSGYDLKTRYQGGHNVFESMFGDSAWRSWQPGDHIQTQYIQNGKLIKLEIFPDGSSKETETNYDSKSSSKYSYSKKETKNGSKQVHIQIDGLNFIEPLLLAFGLPDIVAQMAGKIFSFFLSPIMMFISIIYCCCWPSGKKKTDQQNPYRIDKKMPN